MDNEQQSMPLLGEPLPQLKVKTTQGEMTLPDDYRGHWFVLFSHPGDFTPVCTTEFVSFAQKMGEFEKINTKLIGLSVDQLTPHLKWIEWINENSPVKIPFPVIADELGNVAKKLGMIHPSKGTNTVRAVFIVDPNGIVRLIMYYPQEVGRNIDEILRAIKALQVTDEYKVVTPENFPNNAWLGKNVVIIPPAKTEAAIVEREKGMQNNMFECKDWWLCYKTLK